MQYNHGPFVVLLFILFGGIWALQIRYAPYYRRSMNLLQAALQGILLWGSGVALVKVRASLCLCQSRPAVIRGVH